MPPNVWLMTLVHADVASRAREARDVIARKGRARSILLEGRSSTKQAISRRCNLQHRTPPDKTQARIAVFRASLERRCLVRTRQGRNQVADLVPDFLPIAALWCCTVVLATKTATLELSVTCAFVHFGACPLG